jgi:hypothetical protein
MSRANPAQGISKLVRGKTSTSDPIVDAAWREILSANDISSYLGYMQPVIERARTLHTGTTHLRIDATLDAHNQTHFSGPSWRRTYLTPFSEAVIPNVRKALETVARNETLRQMTLAAIAIRRYELRHGQPPPSLEALVPALLPKLPHDSFSGQPLRYRRTDDGGILLYSVGADGKDDGGDTTPTTRAASWTIWDSPDAVWPKPLEK